MNVIAVYEQVTLALAEETGASDSLLHVHAGLLILFIARLVTRKSLATWVPFSVVLMGALLNEGLDRINHGLWRLPDSIWDLVNTLLWPFVLMVGLRWRRARESERPDGADDCAAKDDRGVPSA